MAKLNNLITITDEIYREIGEPSDTTAMSIKYWLYTNLGKLNNLIYSGYEIDSDTWKISPVMNIQVIDIYKTLYKIHYYDKKILDTLSGAVSNALLEVDSDGSRVKFTNQNEVSKTYLQAKRMFMEELRLLVNSYNCGQATPKQVTGDDASAATDNSATPYSILR